MKTQRRTFCKMAAMALGVPAILSSSAAKASACESDENAESGNAPLSPIFDERLKRKKLERSVRDACRWLTDVAQVKTDGLDAETDANPQGYVYDSWKGAIRSEHRPHPIDKNSAWGNGKFAFFAPVWHTGQAVKALALAYSYYEEPWMLAGACLGAEFLLNNSQRDKNKPNYGAIYAYEDLKGAVSSSALLESCDGLFWLSKVTGDSTYADAAVAAVDRVLQTMYRGDGYFDYGYDLSAARTANGKNNYLIASRLGDVGRPLLDDGVLLKAYRHSGNEEYRRVFFEIADRLLDVERPCGNWVDFIPCNWEKGTIHPRMGFWWGRPMWMAYKESGNKKYAECFQRAAAWYAKAMRRDGGIMRDTYMDFNTTSFGHATSGTGAACAVFHDQIYWMDDPRHLDNLALGLNYQMSMQITRPVNDNMRGVIIEKVVPPSGSDTPPWHVRDLGTTFFVAGASAVMLHSR